MLFQRIRAEVMELRTWFWLVGFVTARREVWAKKNSSVKTSVLSDWRTCASARSGEVRFNSSRSYIKPQDYRGSVMVEFKGLEVMTIEELKERHKSNLKLISEMVGQLYPSILQDENFKIRTILVRKKIYLWITILGCSRMVEFRSDKAKKEGSIPPGPTRTGNCAT